MVDRAVLDGAPIAAEKAGKKLGWKGKRSLLGEKMSSEEKEALASNYRPVVDSLPVYMKEFVGSRVGLEEVGARGALRLSDSVVACLVEESGLPFKKLVQEVYQRLEVEDRVTVASVGSAVLRVGERRMYGVEKKDADVLEDESESWGLEMKKIFFFFGWNLVLVVCVIYELFVGFVEKRSEIAAKSQRGVFGVRHNCRRINERISALLGDNI